MSIRLIKSVTKPQLVTDGAGVLINRVFGHNETSMTDPFLLLDHLKNEDPSLDIPGFPWHPHRGIETISYILEGGIQHEDSMGNKGTLKSGDVQWMTAGSGIIHQEMPIKGESPIFHGFQLWANLPAADKMMPPRYQDIPSAAIPEVRDDDGTKVRVITGEYRGKSGPVTGIVTSPRYLDLEIPPGITKTMQIDPDHTAFAYLFAGNGSFSKDSGSPSSGEKSLVLFDKGEEIFIHSGEEGMRFLLISGKPLKEAIAWHGPIVMNTQEELITAFREYQDGSFLK